MSKAKSEHFVELPFKLENDFPPFENFGNNEPDKYPESLPRHFIKALTKRGDKVFDPFMGLGTTAFVAEELNRVPYGMEYDRKRYEWVAGQLEHWNNMAHGDAANLLKQGFPKMDMAITSPPYMPRHHKWNPLFGGDPAKAGYDKYLKRMTLIFKNLSQVMKRGAPVLVHADNLHHGNHYTPLVRDLATAIEKVMPLKDEIIIRWKPAKDGYPYTHCLVFKNT